MSQIITLTTPLSDQDVEQLAVGDTVLVNGVIYTGRDAAHKRLIDLLAANQPLPLDLKGQILFYVGPSPARPGRVIGAAGPTTSYRMDPYAPQLLRQGLKAMIGKGKRSPEVIEAMIAYKAVYLGAIGGAGALISQAIRAAEIIAYEDLGPEAIRRLVVEDLPTIVINDCRGNDLYDIGQRQYARSR
ncbi:MAG: Fe-S-containing hydro-lyase [Deltaproteobacteria bacterium]|nr:Fe-S-containing hydro-lyase [Deltaproteobacteria bacterium]